MPSWLIPSKWFIAVVATLTVVASVALGLRWAYTAGEGAGSAKQALVLEQWKQQVLEQFTKSREQQLVRLNDLQVQFEELRKKPETIKTVVQRVVVRADAQCNSLPADWRRLWNAEPATSTSNGLPKPAATSTVDHAARVPVAEAAGAVREARVAFENNASQLMACQQYIQRVVRTESGE